MSEDACEAVDRIMSADPEGPFRAVVTEEIVAAEARGAAAMRAHLAAALHAADRRRLASRVVWRNNITDLITDLAGALADDIEAGRL